MTMNSGVHFDRSRGKYIAQVDGKVITKTKSISRAKRILKEHLAGLKEIAREDRANGTDFSVSDRFSFVESLTEMVGVRNAPSLIITGEGGIGKTFTVTKTLHSLGMVESNEEEAVGRPTSKVYKMVRGYSTPYGLYRTLFENSNAIIVFDDCDSILRDPTAINLLKAALDSYSKRYVSWNTERGSDLPSSFLFEGGVIFISNETLSSLDQAVRTRSLCVDLTMTADQKVERMEQLVASGDFLGEYDASVKKDSIALIKENLSKVRNLSLRTLLQVSKIRANTKKDWNKLAMYVLTQK
jgi:hypothetical protein